MVSGQRLEQHYSEFDFAGHVPRDPVQFPHRYEDPADIEAIAFIAASLAFGRVAAFEPHLERICAALGDTPAATLMAATQPTPHPASLLAVEEGASAQYRWIKAADLRSLLLAVGLALHQWGSLEKGFAAGIPSKPTKKSRDAGIWAPLGVFMGKMREFALSVHPTPEERHRAMAFLFPSAKGAAACKRQHMFLRWMVRPPTEGVDFGIWTSVSPTDLICPCDVHTARIGHALGLCSKAEPSHNVADELTRSLRLLDHQDPVRFDFALAHMGISGGCRAMYMPTVCETCGLREACQWWGRI